MFPQLRSDDIVGGSFCSTDGFVDPYSAMNGFMSWAADHGAKLWKNTAGDEHSARRGRASAAWRPRAVLCPPAKWSTPRAPGRRSIASMAELGLAGRTAAADAGPDRTVSTSSLTPPR